MFDTKTTIKKALIADSIADLEKFQLMNNEALGGYFELTDISPYKGKWVGWYKVDVAIVATYDSIEVKTKKKRTKA